MTLLREFASELVGMFIGDVRLTLAVLGLVLLSAVTIRLTVIDPVFVGGILLFGSLLLLTTFVFRASRQTKR